MEGDRGAFLIVQAAIKNVIDFSKADILGRLWWSKLRILLDALEREGYLQLFTLHHSQHLSGLNIPDQERISYHWNEALARIKDYYRLVFPYDKKLAEDKSEVKLLGDTWKQIWGDPNDPEVQARLEKWEEEAKKAFLTKPAKTENKKRVRKFGW